MPRGSAGSEDRHWLFHDCDGLRLNTTAHVRSSPARRSGSLMRLPTAGRGVLLTFLLGAALAGCASSGKPVPTPSRVEVDPWERLNRTDYAIQGRLDRYLVHPLSKAYRFLTPGPIGRGIHNVLVNLSEPAALFNDVLQLRLKRAATPAARLVLNSTVGILGLIDVASHMGLYHHDNEFGVTLGRYRVKPGPYVYLPMVGPSTLRDLLGSGVDFVMDPMRWLDYAHQSAILNARLGFSDLDKEVSTEAELQALLGTAVDPYATLRSAFLQHKQGEIEGDAVPTDLPSFDESMPGSEPAPLPPATAPVTPTTEPVPESPTTGSQPAPLG
jgi:phospholipid-binding lipoprotein MlaA